MNYSEKTLHNSRAVKVFVIMILTATAFVTFTGIGVATGIKGLSGTTVSLVYAAFCHCMSLAVCAGTEAANLWNDPTYLLQAPKVIFFWIGLGVIGTGVLKAVIKAAGLLFNDQRFIKSIPNVSLDEYPRHRAVISRLGLLDRFVLFRGDNLKHSFTFGLWKPKIYMTTGTYSSLTDEEFVSTLLHEDYHRRHRDPLRLFIVTVFRDFLFFLPGSDYLKKVFLEAKEKAADDNAVSIAGKPLELASAIVKLIRPTHGLAHAYLANSMSEMDTVEERVRRLVEPGFENADKRPSGRALFLSTALCAFFFGAIFINGVFLNSQRAKVTPCVSNSCSTECNSLHHEKNHETADTTFWGHVFHTTR